MKYLLQAIEAKRDVVRLSDEELRKLLVEVRSGKDDRIEFTESMTRLLEELRSSEHATAFLAKVAKREAPDYYDVIKNPMDLGTMLRNVKNAKYKNKAQFTKDLELIWENCLIYNSEPTHVLRRSVQILKTKADHLLTYVNDTNDVKKALTQWQPSAGTAKEILCGSPLADTPVISSDEHESAAWWKEMDRSSLLINGVEPFSTSIQVDAGPSRTIGYRSRRKKRRKMNGIHQERETFGGIEALEENVTTIARLRKTHAKFGALMGHIEHEEPIPAALAVVSSDDESENEMNGVKEDSRRSRGRYKEIDMPPSYIPDPTRDPFPKLSSEGAFDILESRSQFLLAHAGFEGVTMGAASVLGDVAAEYMMNIGRTFRMYLDQFAKEMSVEEIILHALYENGGMDIRSLESYIVDDVVRYGSKMADLLKKLQASYRDTLNSSNYTMEDEAYFAENGDGNNDQIMSGTFAQDMGDDFFGFKEMGLDKELGLDMSQLMVPSKLFNKGAQAGSKRAAIGAGAGVNGMAGSRAVEILSFEPPPPYIPISESSIKAQIGLMQPFYREQIRSRGQWQEKASSEEEMEIEDASDEEEYRRHQINKRKQRRIFVLPDEEMERQRYKVPPNGKMPKRAFKEDASKYTSVSTSKPNASVGSKKKKKQEGR